MRVAPFAAGLAAAIAVNLAVAVHSATPAGPARPAHNLDVWYGHGLRCVLVSSDGSGLAAPAVSSLWCQSHSGNDAPTWRINPKP